MTGSYNLIGPGGSGGLVGNGSGNIVLTTLTASAWPHWRQRRADRDHGPLTRQPGHRRRARPISGVTTDQTRASRSIRPPDIGAYQTRRARYRWSSS